MTWWRSWTSTCSREEWLKRLVYNGSLASAEHKEDEHAALNDTVFYKSQLRVALRNCGVINPENIEEYIGMDGYAGTG